MTLLLRSRTLVSFFLLVLLAELVGGQSSPSRQQPRGVYGRFTAALHQGNPTNEKIDGASPRTVREPARQPTQPRVETEAGSRKPRARAPVRFARRPPLKPPRYVGR